MSETEKRSSRLSTVLGAAFLMATSAIGPGFLTQTTVFTKQLLASFGFVILISVILDIFAQMNVWRILAISGNRGQDAANAALPYSGYLLAALVAFGGLVFNIGNIAGTGLGTEALLGVSPQVGAAVSALIAIIIFAVKQAGKAMDVFVKILGVVMLALIVYIVIAAHPPLAEAAYRSIWPESIDARAIVTLVGGTVGGYITFAGAHRLIDAGMVGISAKREIDRGAISGILLTAVIRVLLFLAALGVVVAGAELADTNPAASVFSSAAGDIGRQLFGVMIWAAAITSVVGAAYTSVSFLKSFHSSIDNNANYVIIGFILVSLAVFLIVGQPVRLLVFAGTINGFILPIGLAAVLLVPARTNLLGDYRHPIWHAAAGWTVVAIMSIFSVITLYNFVI
ncbi:MAG TPA: divalent metal cation transporter [Pyrinomonadaceae bacterium]|nr:divalent metal cation transporter [Pyrinomonadaceae bacterium]